MNIGISHGGAGTAYSHNGCRCPECTAANTSRTARRRAERYATPKDPNDLRHGTPSFYGNWGCRCDKCGVAWSKEMKRQADNRKARA